ncbi:hypothetical protein [Rickettsia endosymbiont of Polydrusus tereticollis]|uniref:hypothetical protein n=1 Tax=Rickettsia endosymbiont of Polydrusus tereticollis TaxID=3066251 RepID=UPI003133355D|nr:hypothetical protein [Rickettsia endosymbiont of Oxypoda opaca]
MNKNYLILFFAAAILIGCKDKAPTKPKPTLAVEADPSPAIIRTIEDTNRNIGNNIARIPTPPTR